MAKVVVKKPADGWAQRVKAKDTSVTAKKIRTGEGTVQTMFTLDAGSDTFGADLSYVFGRNVAKARRENKRLTGSADGRPGKR